MEKGKLYALFVAPAVHRLRWWWVARLAAA
jgi:hypothetical protein